MTNYSIYALEFQSTMNREFNKCIIEQMQLESQFILSSLDKMVITMENTTNQDKKGLFSKLIQFFKDILERFIDKTAYLMKKNNEWLEANKENLKKINYDGLEIEMIPFWLNDHKKNINDVKLAINKLTSVANSNRHEEYGDYDKLVKDIFPHYVDENDNFVNGLKNYFRTNNAKGPIKTVQLRGNDLKNKINNEFIKYCSSYQNDVVPAIKSAHSMVEKNLSMLEGSMIRAEKKESENKSNNETNNTNKNDDNKSNTKTDEQKKEPTKESMCLIENCTYGETELIYCQNFEAVFEADEQKKVSATSVQIKDHGNNDNAQKQDAYDSMNTTQLKFFKNVATIEQHLVSAVMTVLEERYMAYMNAMKNVMQARGEGLNKTEEKKPDENKK